MLYFFPSALGILNLTPIQFVGYVGATITFLCDYIGQILSGINISWLINDSPIENSAVQATKLVVNSTLGRFIEGLVIEKIPASWNNSYIWCRAHTPEGGSIKSNLSNVKLQGNRFYCLHQEWLTLSASLPFQTV